MNEYFFHQKQKNIKLKVDTSGSFGFKSSQFSQKNNNSSRNNVKKQMDPSFFNQSSIKNLNQNQSGQFIYFQNDSVLSQLENQLNSNKKGKQKQKQDKKKKQQINFSKEIQFQDSFQKSNHYKNNLSEIKQFGTGKSNLPPTLKKPKFGFKISETAQSSQIIRQVEQQYLIKLTDGNKQSKVSKVNEISRSSNTNEQIQIKKYHNGLKKDESISSIRRPIEQPSIISKSLSSENQINSSMNFKSVFKNKVEKASSINSSLNKGYKKLKQNKSLSSLRQLNQQNHKFANQSISKNSFLQKQVKIAQLKDLRELQNKLGQLKHQNKKIIEYMIQRDQEIQKLKRKKQQIQSEDPYAVIKQNQLMKAFLNKKSPNKKISKQLISQQSPRYSRNLHSARSLKQISAKKSSQISSLHDYDTKQHKFKVQPKKLTKIQKKFILSNRGMLQSDKYIDVGYSLKDMILTIYLTIKRDCDQVRVKLQENSIIVAQSIDRDFKNISVGKQIKFKTEIKTTKCNSPEEEFILPVLKIALSTEQKFQNKVNQFKIQIPISVYNLAKQIEPYSHQISSQKLSNVSAGKQSYRTQTFVGCRQMIKNPQIYLLKLFPCGYYDPDEKIFHIGFLWKQKQQNMKIKIKQRSFVIQGDGNPHKGTFQILRSIVSLLIQQQNTN